MARHAANSFLLIQIRAVFKAESQCLLSRSGNQRQIEFGYAMLLPKRHNAKLIRRLRRFISLLRVIRLRILPDDYRIEQRVAAQVARQLKLLDQQLKRVILMLEDIQRIMQHIG
ncbi:hypothetical protein D3C78_1614310 [compost metagenome]